MMERALDNYEAIVDRGINGIDSFIASRQSEEMFTDFKRSADDGKGGVISSNRFKLSVKEPMRISFIAAAKKNIAAYSNYILIGVLILVIMILLIEFRKPLMKFLEE